MVCSFCAYLQDRFVESRVSHYNADADLSLLLPITAACFPSQSCVKLSLCKDLGCAIADVHGAPEFRLWCGHFEPEKPTQNGKDACEQELEPSEGGN